MKQNPYYEIRVFILEDSNGEWWETVGQDGTTRRFRPGTATLNRAKSFPSVAKAEKFALAHYAGRKIKVIHLSPPILPSHTWVETIALTLN